MFIDDQLSLSLMDKYHDQWFGLDPRNGDHSHTQSQERLCIAFNSNSEWRGWLRKQSLIIIYDDADEGYYAGVNFEIHQVRTFGGRDVRWGGEQHFGDCEVDFGFSIKHWITFEGHSIRNFAINIHQKNYLYKI